MATSNTQLNVTYASVVELFSQACSNHVGIGQFDTGTIDYLDASAVNKSYPLVFLRPVSSTGVVDNTRTLSFELFALDVPKLKDESPVDTLSNMEMLLYEVLGYVNWGPLSSNTYDVEMGNLTPVNEAFQDRVYGWVATIDVLTPFVLSACTYPDGQPTPTPTPSPTPVVPTPTPSPTPTPDPYPGVQSFQTPWVVNALILETQASRACDDAEGHILNGNYTQVYAAITNPGAPFPENIYGSIVYFDPELTDRMITADIFENYEWTTVRMGPEQPIYYVKVDDPNSPPAPLPNINGDVQIQYESGLCT